MIQWVSCFIVRLGRDHLVLASRVEEVFKSCSSKRSHVGPVGIRGSFLRLWGGGISALDAVVTLRCASIVNFTTAMSVANALNPKLKLSKTKKNLTSANGLKVVLMRHPQL